jgi:hypothetical protein
LKPALPGQLSSAQVHAWPSQAMLALDARLRNIRPIGPRVAL